MLEEYRIDGRFITAKDVAERLMPDLNINEVLLWSPDLFAYTSYILTMTSAYQLVVSPPSGRCWEPTSKDIVSWLCHDIESNLNNWVKSVIEIWDCENEDYVSNIQDQIESKINEIKKLESREFLWKDLVNEIAKDWRNNFDKINDPTIFNIIDDNEFTDTDRKSIRDDIDAYRKDLIKNNNDEHIIKKLLKEKAVFLIKEKKKLREKQLLNILLTNTPPLLLGCWVFFYNEITKKDFCDGKELNISDLLCNQDNIQRNISYCDNLWKISQSLLTMHAISDIASLEFGIKDNFAAPLTPSLEFAQRLLFGRQIGNLNTVKVGGSLSTFNNDRARVLPKRHNPGVGITLRSISSNLAFHQSATDVVWRKAENNVLAERLIRNSDDDFKQKRTHQKFSILLLPFPLDIKSKDFKDETSNNILKMENDYGFFAYEPHSELKPSEKDDVEKDEVNRASNLILEANRELPENYNVDIVVFPEQALSLSQFKKLQEKFKEDFSDITPSVLIAGIRESKAELIDEMKKQTDFTSQTANNELNFARNAVYCKYYDRNTKKYYNGPANLNKTPRYKQYKHHRWQLEETQIKRYGLSGVLDTEKIWWENTKVPKRRVSFLNVGDRLTVSHLICEDLARQDPIAELIRHVGPSLVVTILMDGPQFRNRWSSRYATVLSNDPGSSVITLTSLGMVKRYISEFGLMSRVVAIWSESGSSHPREIELAQGAEAILLTLEIEQKAEKTADGRTETTPTSIVRLVDVIQVYPPNK